MLLQAREPPCPENGCWGRHPNPLETDLQSVILAALSPHCEAPYPRSRSKGWMGVLGRLSGPITAAY